MALVCKAFLLFALVFALSVDDVACFPRSPPALFVRRGVNGRLTSQFRVKAESGDHNGSSNTNTNTNTNTNSNDSSSINNNNNNNNDNKNGILSETRADATDALNNVGWLTTESTSLTSADPFVQKINTEIIADMGVEVRGFGSTGLCYGFFLPLLSSNSN